MDRRLGTPFDDSDITEAIPASHGVASGAFRLPAATRLGGVTLQVSDLSRSRRFYEETLGLHVLGDSDGRVQLGAADGRETLIELVGGAHPASARKRLGLFHVAILLPTRADLGRFLAHLQAAEVRAGAGDHMVSEALYLQDPDDLGVEVYADRPAESWQRSGMELVMATDPIDARGLLAAGGGTPWRGMPGGTNVGHVHLHVGELTAASRFYSAGVGLDRTVWSYPGALFLAAGGYHHHLGVNTWAGPTATPAEALDPRLLEWTLVLPTADDVVALASHLRGAGEAVREEGRAIVVHDPWRTALRVSPAA